LVLSTLAVGALSARDAGATTEASGLDARWGAQAGAGVASAEGAVSLFYNPARLNSVGVGDLTLGAQLINVRQKAPLFGPYQAQSSNEWAPVGFLDGAYRFTDKLVLSASFQPASGSGGNYTTPGGPLSLTAVAAEGSVGGSYAILPNLWVGAQYRVTYTHVSTDVPTSLPNGASVDIDTKLHGFNFAGAAFGVYFAPLEHTGIGLYFRTRTNTTINGSSTIAGASYDASSRASSPDKIALGASQTFLRDALRVSIEGSVFTYGALDSATVVTVQTPGAPTVSTTVTDLKTIWEGKVGGELWVLPRRFAVRAGLWFGPEPNRAGNTSALGMPPGFFFAPSLGAGVQAGAWNFDLAATDQLTHGETVDSTINGNPGRYERSLFDVQASARWRFE
jgi:hypothetical protein